MFLCARPLNNYRVEIFGRGFVFVTRANIGVEGEEGKREAWCTSAMRSFRRLPLHVGIYSQYFAKNIVKKINLY